MRKIVPSLVGVALAVAFCVALVDAQPAPGFSKTAPLAGTGSSGSPLRITPCSAGHILESDGSAWSCISTPSSSGDIDAVTAGIGLEGGGLSGTVSLSLLSSCADGQVLKSASSGTSWVCANDTDTDSGGDITSVGATSGGGLTGGATSGAALLGLLTTCSFGQVLQWDGDSWECDDDDIGSPGAGDIESVTAGDGLTGGGTVGALTIDVGCGTGLSCAADAISVNISGASCSAGQYVSAISATGGGTCTAEVGDISGVTAGDGLTGGGSSGAVTVQMRQDCNNGQVVKWSGSDWVCDDDDTSSGFDTAGTGLTSSGTTVNVVCGSNLACAADSVNLATNVAVGGTLSTVGTATIGGSLAVTGDASFKGGFTYTNDAELNFFYGTNSTATGYINYRSYAGGFGAFRNLIIADGTSAAVVTFTGNTKTVDFWGPVNMTGSNNTVNELTSSGTIALNGTNNTVGNADSDNFNSRATLAFSGTDPTVASGSCTISGEAQSFRLTKTVGGSGSCTVNLQRTFNSAPFCAISRASSKTADIYQSGETTSSVSFTFSDDATINVLCPDRR